MRRELAAKLSGLCDGEAVAIARAYLSTDLYRGPYLGAAPDLIVGYADGYRASWDAAVGKVTDEVFVDNTKAWCGDHCVDPHLVPGVLFSNRLLKAQDPGIEDMAPTALRLFGIRPPVWMEGSSVV
jgi:predicted AlkP superfamily phosphohydrolase/phosphomutase